MSAVTATDSEYAQAERALWAHHGLAPVDHRVELGALGTGVRVQAVGAGDPVLLLHGSPTAGAAFAPLVAGLEGHRCLVPDIPPGGLSDAFTVTPDSAAALVDHLVTDLLDALDVERAHVVASSSGSLFALRAAARAPARVGRVVHLGAPGLVACVRPRPSERLLLVPGVARVLGALRPGPRGQRSMHASIGHGASIAADRIPPAYWDWYDALVRRTTTFRDQLGMLPALRGRGLSYDRRLVADDEVLAAQGPTHVIWGEHERLATRDDAAAFVGRMPDATLEVVAGAGHLPWLDRPTQVADSVASFLGSDA